MIDDIINQAINEAKSTPAVEEAGTPPIQQDSVESQDTQSEPAKDTSGQENQPDVSYKTLQNALDRRKKQIGKQKDEIRQIRSELDSLRASMTKAPQISDQPQVPDYSKFDTFEDYFKAREEFLEKSLVEKLGSKFNPPQQTPNQSSQPEEPRYTQSQIQQLVKQQQRIEHIKKQEEDLIKQIPDYDQTFESHRDVIEELPQNIQEIFFEVDNAPLALFQLISEGKLQDLANYSPGKAAIELMRAQMRGEQILKKRITNTPAPMGGVRGVSRTNNGKLTNNSSVDDVMKWLYDK